MRPWVLVGQCTAKTFASHNSRFEYKRSRSVLPKFNLPSPLLLPLAAGLVEHQVLALLLGLGLDTLALGELLPLGGRFRNRQGLLAGEGRVAGREREEHAVGFGRVCGAGGQELVDERLRTVAGDAGERDFEIGLVNGERVGIGG